MKLSAISVLSLSFVTLIGCNQPKQESKPLESAQDSQVAAQPPAKAVQQATTPPEVKAVIRIERPLKGATVFPKSYFAIETSDGLELQGGKLVLLEGAQAVEVGQTVPASRKVFEVKEGKPYSALVELEGEGEKTLFLQTLDKNGKVLRQDDSVQVKVIPSQGERGVSFVAPENGAKLKSPVKFVFGVKGMKIVPAGKDPLARTSGHHHLLIGEKSYPLGQVIPADKTHLHFGKGQTEATVELPPGEHTIGMQFADGTHSSYGPEMAASIKITVE
ncbi:MAG: DUF4399 domain-containing protein [Polyangiaceae bacterium]|nr:DUF4399 domain-containing protein [Polyangiaceae bacterium]